jgi:hypothetical protein
MSNVGSQLMPIRPGRGLMELIVHPAIETEGKEDDELMELTRKVMSLLPSPDCLLCIVMFEGRTVDG